MNTLWAENNRDQKNHTLGFYTCVDIEGEEALLEIAASNVYRLFINAKLIGYGPARAAHGYTRKDIYSLAAYQGQTVHVAVEVFASNINSFYIIEELPFFGVEIRTAHGILAESEDFEAYLLTDRVQKVQRYSYQRPFVESYQMKKCRNHFYKGDGSAYEKVKTAAVESNVLIDRNIGYPQLREIAHYEFLESGTVLVDETRPIWKDRSIYQIDEFLKGFQYDEIKPCISDVVSKFVYKKNSVLNNRSQMSDGEYRVFDFKRTLTGFFRLQMTVSKPTTLFLIWDEVIQNENETDEAKDICFYRNHCCNIIRVELNQGTYDFLAFEPTSARFLKVVIAQGEADLLRLSMVLYENDNAYKLQFRSDDPTLDRIIFAAQNTLAQNAVDVLTDCPSRERAGWLCDAYFSGKAEKLMTGINEIERNFLENYCLAPTLRGMPEGMLPMCYPSDHYNGGYIPNWAMWYVLELLDYTKRTGDRRLADQSKEKIIRLLDFFNKYLNEDGLLENLEGWIFIEWSKCNDKEHTQGVNYPSNMLYCAMLRAISDLYDDLDYTDKADMIRGTIINQSFNGIFFEDNRIRENGKLVAKFHLTETCQYYAFYFDIADPSKFPELLETMITRFGPARDIQKVYPEIAKSNAIVGNYLRLELLLRYGYNQKVIEESKAFFANMAQMTSTLWEHSFVSGSLNHGFASVAANYIVEALTGYVGVDHTRKAILFKEAFLNRDVTVKISFMEGELTVSVRNSHREIQVPPGYCMEIVTDL
jgi:alpha-L-rhamnosidase